MSSVLYSRFLNWLEKGRGAFTYFDVERGLACPREAAVALVARALDAGKVQAGELGWWRRARKPNR